MEESLLVFLFVLFILVLIFFILITSKIKIKIDNFKFNYKSKIKLLNDKYNVRIQFIIFNFLPIFWVNINKKKIEKLKRNSSKSKLQLKLQNKIKSEISFNKIVRNISKGRGKQIQEILNLKINKFNLELNFGTDFMFLTNLLIPIISTGISTFLYKYDAKKTYYRILPIYNLGNTLLLSFSGEFEIKVADIIKIIHIYGKNDTYYKCNM